MLFTFAGTGHSRYTQYLLEFICALEFESSPELRETVLKSVLVNLTGEPGRFAAIDIIQEYFNRLLQAIAERKGAEYNTHFVRNVVSRNLHHLARLRDESNKGIGLAARSGQHTRPRKDAELRTLLKEYKLHELHHRRPGRTFVSGAEIHKISDFRKGLANLRSGKLKKWINETLFMRGTQPSQGVPGEQDRTSPEDSDNESDSDEPEPENDELEGPGPLPTLPSISLVDGRLEIDTYNIEGDVQHLLDTLVDDNMYSEASESDTSTDIE